MLHPDIDKILVEEMPHFIAVNYQKLLTSVTPQDKLQLALHIYKLGLRALTIGIISQYLVRDRETVSDSFLNEQLLVKLPNMTLDSWHKILFLVLGVYESKQHLFFMPELYDFYWDTSKIPHRKREEVELPFDRMTQIAMDHMHDGLMPNSSKSWPDVSEEAIYLLREIMTRLSFIRTYDLIRVIKREGDLYNLELHKGLNITVKKNQMFSGKNLQPGWFYLCKNNDEFLVLHPFLIFWDDTPTSPTNHQPGVAIYERLYVDQLQYILALVGEAVLDHRNAHIFVQMLYETIEEFKRIKKEADRLTWLQLRDISKSISLLRTAALTGKYNKEVYLHRHQIVEQFSKFLKSPKKGFVLVGKSGVGKSNFLLSVSDELTRQSDVCVLIYDAAQLRQGNSLSNIIKSDFDDQLVLTGTPVNNIWHEIAKVEGIQNKRVVLFVDAVNENVSPRDLLWELDQLIQAPWPWLKVVLTCRPETWNTIKRGVKLSEPLYYKAEVDNSIGVVLEPFGYSAEVIPFSYSELSTAFERYRLFFNVGTRYEQLPVRLRHLLREPLNLWIVSNTYANQNIPSGIMSNEIVGNYIEALTESGRLDVEDIILLETKLVPLMCQREGFINTLNPKTLASAEPGLYEAIYSDQLLSSGNRMNQSFRNLLDAEILALHSIGYEHRIAFKYERFYEYFVGQAMFDLLGNNADHIGLIREWTARINETPFVWGALKHCLQLYFLRLPREQISTFCKTLLSEASNPMMVDICIAFLSESGIDHPGKVHAVIVDLLNSERDLLSFRARSRTLTSQCPNSKYVAIHVATKLNFADALLLSLTDPSPSVRAVAIRYGFIYWQKDKIAGFELLGSLANQSLGTLNVPSPSVFESYVGLSLLIFFSNYQDRDVTKQLQQIWRPTIERTLRVNPDRPSGIREWMNSRFRSALLNSIISFIIRTASEIQSNSALSIPELRRFFKKDKDQAKRKSIAKELVSHMKVAQPDLGKLRTTLLSLVSERDMFITWIAVCLLHRYTAFGPTHQILPIVRELFNEAIEVSPPGPFSIYVCPEALSLKQPFVTEEIRELYTYMVTTYLDKHKGEWWSYIYRRRFTFIDGLCHADIGDELDVELTPTAKQVVVNMVANRDYAWINDIIKFELRVRGVQSGYLKFVFSTVSLLIRVDDLSVREEIVQLLAQLYLYYPNEVEDFLIVESMSEADIRQVRSRAPSQTLGDILDLRAVSFWYEGILRNESEDLWNSIIWLFDRLPESTSLREWLVLLIKVAVNKIYGDKIFTEVL